MSAARKTRVEHGLRDVLQAAIANDVRDPRVRAATMVTVSKVEVNVDMSVARVYVSIVGDEATSDGVIAGLQKAAGFLRGQNEFAKRRDFAILLELGAAVVLLGRIR